MSTPISQHPDPATLMSFAAGSLSEPLAAAVAAHASMCAGCRTELDDMDLMGAALLGASTAAPGGGVPAPARPRDTLSSAIGPHNRRSPNDKLPAPIARQYGITLDTIPWKRLAPGVWQHRLPLSPGVKGDLRFYKLAPGAKLPDHGHAGAELTLVLDGIVVDGPNRCHVGDLHEVDDQVEHEPGADNEVGCICLVASEGPPRLTGWRGLVLRLLHRWRRRSHTESAAANKLG